MSMTTFCTFHLHDLHIGVEVTNVQEVLRTQEMTRAPLAPPGRQRADQPPRADRHRARPARQALTATTRR